MTSAAGGFASQVLPRKEEDVHRYLALDKKILVGNIFGILLEKLHLTVESRP